MDKMGIEALHGRARAHTLLPLPLGRVRDMEEATALPGGDEIVTDQVLYNM
jgi:hypothetical protein